MAMYTAYPNAPVAYREGKLEYSGSGCVASGVAENTIRAGCGLVAGTGQQVDHPAVLAAADPDALVTAAVAISNVAGLRINTIAEFDGVGQGGAKTRIIPARPVTIAYDADAGWDTVDGQRVDTIFGEDADGNPFHEDLVKANGSGAVELETVQKFSWVDVVDQQAGLAGTGTATIGVGVGAAYGRADFLGIAVYDRMTPPSATTHYDYDALLPVGYLTGSGVIGAIPEDAVTVGEHVFMRIVAGAGALIRGRFTGHLQADDADFCRVLGLKWKTAAAGGSPALIEVTR